MTEDQSDILTIHDFPPDLNDNDSRLAYEKTCTNLQPINFKPSAVCCCCDIEYPSVCNSTLKMMDPILPTIFGYKTRYPSLNLPLMLLISPLILIIMGTHVCRNLFLVRRESFHRPTLRTMHVSFFFVNLVTHHLFHLQ
jgi:hypothetical protein